MGAKILIIEDDAEFLDSLRTHLEESGYTISTEADGEKGIQRALSEHFDLIISDLGLPKQSGFDVCREVRFNNNNVPILILSAQSDVFDKVIGLEIGADDYLTKPFHHRELKARIDALLRRATRSAAHNSNGKDNLIFKGLVIDRERMKVSRDGEPISLTATEYRALETLAQSPGRVFSREELRDQVWGYAASSFDQTVTTTFHRLRHKLEKDPSNPEYIFAVRGVGYRFADESGGEQEKKRN